MSALTHGNESVVPSRRLKLCGTDEIDPPSQKLAAGPLTAELENGQLRYIALNGVEVLRGIAFLVRDQNWGTYAPQINSLSVTDGAGQFTVEYKALCADANQRLAYEARISGSSDGVLTFDTVATPETDFVTNRAGFVVLHPAWLAGQRLKVAHVDGREAETIFPARISPSQPVFDIRALAHEAAPGLWATCRMEGDAFEMEDQRNWTDASYKTYVRPLALPWGYTLAKGSRHEQSVHLSFSGNTAGRGEKSHTAITIELGRDLSMCMPELGVALPHDEIEAASAAIDVLRVLKPSFLVCHADMRESRDLAAFETIRQVGEAAAAKIVLEVVVPDDADGRSALEPVAAAARRARLEIDSIVISSAADLKSWQPGATRPEKPTVEDIAAAARAAFPGPKLGGGMLSTFTELNRKRPKAALFDFITHTTCSIVHAADDRSVMETLETLPAIIWSAKAMIDEKPYRIGPSAIAARMNPYGKGVAENPANGRVCLTNRDPRQRGLFNAAWTLGYRRRLRLWRGAVGRDGRRYRPARVHSPPYGQSSAALFRCDQWPGRLSRVPCDERPRTWRRPSSRQDEIVRTGQGGGTRVARRRARCAVARKSHSGTADNSYGRLPKRATKSECFRSLHVREGSRLAGCAGGAEASARGSGTQFRRLRSRMRRNRQQVSALSGDGREKSMTAQGLKELAQTKSPKFGHFIVEFATPGIGHILKSAGCDFVLFDLEHSGFGFETVKSAIRYFEAADVPVIVRVPSKEYHHIARAMDMGAEGLMLPMVGNVDEARHILKSMKYTPDGGRGVALQVSHDRYRPGPVVDKFVAANRRSTFFCQIETADGVENADAIAALPGVDCLWVGHFDLSVSLGVPGEFGSKTFTDAIARVCDAARKHRKSLGRLVPTVQQGVDLFSQGFDFICYSGDVWVLHDALKDAIDKLREGCGAADKPKKAGSK